MDRDPSGREVIRERKGTILEPDVARIPGRFAGMDEERTGVLDETVVDQGLGTVQGQARVGRIPRQERLVGFQGGIGLPAAGLALGIPDFEGPTETSRTELSRPIEPLDRAS